MISPQFLSDFFCYNCIIILVYHNGIISGSVMRFLHKSPPDFILKTNLMYWALREVISLLMINMVHWATGTLGQCIFKEHHRHLQREANGEGGNGSLKLWLPSWLPWHMASTKASGLPSGVFLALFLLTLPDSFKCSTHTLPVRSSAAADEAHQAMTTTWESHWNAESPWTCDCMIPGKELLILVNV